MQTDPEFLVQLTEAYYTKLDEVEKNLVPRLKEDVALFHSHFHSLYEMLIDKGVLRKDPYKNDRHLSDIAMLPDAFMNENEYDDQLPIRLSEFDNMLDFLINYTAFSSDQLSLKRLRIILSIIKFINWSNLTVTINLPSTRALAAVVDKLKMSSDAVNVGAVMGNIAALEKVYKQIQKDLKELADFKREEYKYVIRHDLLPHANIQGTLSKDEFSKHAKSAFAKHLSHESFFPELIGELYDEMLQENIDAYRQEILKRFHVELQKKKIETKKIDLLAILLEGLRNTGTASRHLEESITKLQDNHVILKNQPKTFMERFKEWIVSLSGPKVQGTMISIEIVDIATTIKKIESINFEQFCASVVKKARTFAALAIKTSSLYQRFETGKEEEAYDFLHKSYNEIRDYHEKLDALDLYFKTETPVTERNKLRGIKVELTGLKNALATINQKLHEFIARKEEVEQLRKLGIET